MVAFISLSAFKFRAMTPARNIVLIFSLALTVYCNNVIPQNPLESQVFLLLQKWRMGQVNSDIIPLPSLKSVIIPYVEHSYNRKGIKMNYMINKMELTGLDCFSIQELLASAAKKTLEMSITVIIPKLILHADNYEINGRAYLVYPLSGSGNMTVIFRDSEFTFKIVFGSTSDGKSTKIKNFVFDFNVDNIEANFVNSSWPINKVLNSDGVEILASYHDDIEKALWNYIVPYVDKNLTSVTIEQIVNRILNTSL